MGYLVTPPGPTPPGTIAGNHPDTYSVVAPHEFRSPLARFGPRRLTRPSNCPLQVGLNIGACDGSSAKRELRGQDALAIWCNPSLDMFSKNYLLLPTLASFDDSLRMALIRGAGARVISPPGLQPKPSRTQV